MSYHDKKGRFCPPSRAHMMSKDGQHFRVVRSHRRIDPKTGKEIRMKKGTPLTLAHVELAKSRAATALAISEGNLLSIEDILEWSKESGVAATFKHKTAKGRGKPRERGRGYGKLISPPEKTSPGKRGAMKTAVEKTVVGKPRPKKVAGARGASGEVMVFGKWQKRRS